MNNIVDTCIMLLNKNNQGVSNQDIIDNLDNPQLKNLSEAKLLSRIDMDLMYDGRFLLVDKKWHLKDEYTIEEIISELYKNIGDYEIEVIENETNHEEELQDIEMAFNIDEQDQLEKEDANSVYRINEEYEE